MSEHSKLVKEAAHWLRSTRGCMLVVSEMACANSREFPDAMGWRGIGESVLVECKASITDFRADKHKPHRQYDGLGQERWFYAKRGVIPVSELPEGWGLLERQEILNSHMVRKSIQPVPRPRTVEMLDNERRILISSAWRALEAVSLVKPLTITERV